MPESTIAQRSLRHEVLKTANAASAFTVRRESATARNAGRSAVTAYTRLSGAGVGGDSLRMAALTGRASETGAVVGRAGAAAGDGAETGRATGWLSSTTFLRFLPFLPSGLPSGFAAGFAAAATTGCGRVFLPPRRFGGGGGAARVALAAGAEAARGGGGGGGP